MNHKPLVTSTPVHSILNPGFRYTSSAATDIRKTFARIRREQAKAAAASSARSLIMRSQDASARALRT